MPTRECWLLVLLGTEKLPKSGLMGHHPPLWAHTVLTELGFIWGAEFKNLDSGYLERTHTENSPGLLLSICSSWYKLTVVWPREQAG